MVCLSLHNVESSVNGMVTLECVCTFILTHQAALYVCQLGHPTRVYKKTGLAWICTYIKAWVFLGFCLLSFCSGSSFPSLRYCTHSHPKPPNISSHSLPISVLLWFSYCPLVPGHLLVLYVNQHHICVREGEDTLLGNISGMWVTLE